MEWATQYNFMHEKIGALKNLEKAIKTYKFTSLNLVRIGGKNLMSDIENA